MSIHIITAIGHIDRNRRLLKNALAAGCGVRKLGRRCYEVDSQTSGAVYLVKTRRDDYGRRKYKCGCAWGKHHGWIFQDPGFLPCAHVLLVCWERLSDAKRAAYAGNDRELEDVARRLVRPVA